MKLQDLLENEDLESYRREALKLIKSRASEWKREASQVLGLPVTKVEAAGSVVDKKRFNEESDIDVAFYVSAPGKPDGVDEELSEKLQAYYVKHPTVHLGVINTLVFVRNK